MSLSKRQSQILQVLKNSSYEVSGNDLANLTLHRGRLEMKLRILIHYWK